MATGGIFWLLALGALIFLMMRKGGGCCGGHDHGGHGGHRDDPGARPSDAVGHSGHGAEHGREELENNRTDAAKDPVCGMEVGRSGAMLSSDYRGHLYHFCSEKCKKLFELYPDKYAAHI